MKYNESRLAVCICDIIDNTFHSGFYDNYMAEYGSLLAEKKGTKESWKEVYGAIEAGVDEEYIKDMVRNAIPDEWYDGDFDKWYEEHVDFILKVSDMELNSCLLTLARNYKANFGEDII